MKCDFFCKPEPTFYDLLQQNSIIFELINKYNTYTILYKIK